MKHERNILAFLVLLVSGLSEGKKPPNIIFIMADDLGWNDVSFHGSPQIPTPNIDAFAADGLVLSNYYVNPICSPSRSALLTGIYPIHTGMQHDVLYGAQPYGLPLDLKIMPQHFKDLGYDTHIVGKWHLGFYTWDYTPTYRGFDTFLGYYLGRIGYYDHVGIQNELLGYDLRDNKEVAWNLSGVYATQVFTERAVQIIENHDPVKPLFLYLPHLAAHAGNSYALFEALAQYDAKFPHIPDLRRRLFAGIIGALDDSLGKVISALQEAKLLENSIIVFTTDNGGAAGGIDASVGSNFPLKGTKYTLWEGGVRGTAAIWSPLLGETNGADRNQLMHLIDWLPTLYNAAGGNVVDLGCIDGENMWEALKDNTASKRDTLIHNIDPIDKTWAVRSGKYKLISGTFGARYDQWFGPSGRNLLSAPVFPTLPSLANSSLVASTFRLLGRSFTAPTLDWYKKHDVKCGSYDPTKTQCQPTKTPCLYNIEEDPCEMNNLAHNLPQVVNELMELMLVYNASSVAPINKPNDFKGADPDQFGFAWTPWRSENNEISNRNAFKCFADSV